MSNYSDLERDVEDDFDEGEEIEARFSIHQHYSGTQETLSE